MRQRGFTILELTLALITFGTLISVIVTLLNASTNPASATGQTAAEATLMEADRSVVGFALANFVFPSPVGAAPVDINGLIPGQLSANDVGMATSPKAWYWVDSRLLDPSPYTPDPDNLTQGNLPSRQIFSLVDLCGALKTVQQSPNGFIQGVPVAVVLATLSSGAGATVPATLPLPGSSAALQLATQGFSVSALGASELLERLHCPRALGAVSASMRSVAIATDLQTWATDLGNFRNLQLASDQQSDFSTNLRLGLAIATLSVLGADMISTTVQTAMSLPDARSLVSSAEAANNIVGIGVLAANIATTIYQLVTIEAQLSALPSSVASDQLAVTAAGVVQSNTASALKNAQSSYSWSLLGL
ncbi:hypothetical protein AAB992_01205 [Burkholderia contaminans]|uniref:type II secretion system protein n=1 Tax=Burkholderia contaminans TaxID=488447 RepID=UPI002417CCF2|nr:hypothetical protein [Burkholderia contaminans]WFN14910.1 hypothetical protein LXE92_32305 [Burkholderia contaminans]